MASKRKSGKSNFTCEDINELLNTSQFMNSPKNKKIQKLVHNETFEEKSGIKAEPISKKKRIESNLEATQKVFNFMDQQLIKRKKSNENLLNSLSDILSELKADDEVMTENEQKLDQLIGALMKCIQQSTHARKQKLKKLEEIQGTYKKIFEEIYLEEKSEKKVVSEELNNDINKLQEKLISDAKLSGFEKMRKIMCLALQNEYPI